MATFLAATPELVLHLATAAAANSLPQRRAAVKEQLAGSLRCDRNVIMPFMELQEHQK